MPTLFAQGESDAPPPRGSKTDRTAGRSWGRVQGALNHQSRWHRRQGWIAFFGSGGGGRPTGSGRKTQIKPMDREGPAEQIQKVGIRFVSAVMP